jgi:Leucine-rich repeat (LRR) protein
MSFIAKMYRFFIGLLLLKQIQSQKLTCDENTLKVLPNGCTVFNFNFRSSMVVQYTNLKKIATSLELKNGDMETIPTDLFTNYPNIQLFSVQNSKLQNVAKGNFKNGGNLQVLGFSQNNLAILKNSTFEGSSGLNTLMITDEVNLKTVEVGAFKGLPALIKLSITNGSISSLQPGIFDDLTSLNILEMDHQKLKTIPLNLFTFNTKLVEVSFPHNQISQIPPNAFNSITNLQQLDLGYNQLQRSPTFNAGIISMPGNILKAIQITNVSSQIDVSNNNITTITCNKNMIVVNLNIANNLLKGLQCIPKITSLVTLDISNNRFAGIKKAKVSKLTKLQYLKLDGNKLRKPRPIVFSNSKQLISLQIDNLTNYKPLKKFFPNLLVVVLTTKNWDCNQVQQVADTLRPQNISIELNGEYTSFKSFKCQTSSEQLNRPIDNPDEFALF